MTYGINNIFLRCAICSLFLFSTSQVVAQTQKTLNRTWGPIQIGVNWTCQANGNYNGWEAFFNVVWSAPTPDSRYSINPSSEPPPIFDGSWRQGQLNGATLLPTQLLSEPYTLYVFTDSGPATQATLLGTLVIGCTGTEGDQPPDPCPPFQFAKNLRNNTDSPITYTVTLSWQGGGRTFDVTAQPSQITNITVTENLERVNGDCPPVSVNITDQFGNVYYDSTGNGNPADLSSIYDSISDIWDKLEECPICDVSSDVASLQQQLNDLATTTNEHINNSGIHWNMYQFNQLKNYLDATYAKIEDLQSGNGDMSEVAQALASLANAVSAQATANVQANTIQTTNQSVQIAQAQLGLDKLDSLKAKLDISNNNLSNIDNNILSFQQSVENLISGQANSDMLGYVQDSRDILQNIRDSANINSNNQESAINDVQQSIESLKNEEIQVKEVNSDDILSKLNDQLLLNRQLQDESNTKSDEIKQAISDIPDSNDLLEQIKNATQKTSRMTDIFEADAEDESGGWYKMWKARGAYIDNLVDEEAFASKLTEKMNSTYSELETPDIPFETIPEPQFSPNTNSIQIGGQTFSYNFFEPIMFTAPWIKQFIILVTTLLFIVWAIQHVNASFHTIIIANPVYTLSAIENNIPFFSIAKSKMVALAISAVLASAPVILSAIFSTWLPAKDLASSFFADGSVVSIGYNLISQFIPIQHIVVLILNKLSFFPLLWVAAWGYVMLVKLAAI